MKTGDLHGSAGSNPALSSTITGCGLIGKSPLLGSGHHPGSSPGIPTNVFVAQLVLEHLTFNEGVTGSSPVGDTKEAQESP